MLIPQFSLRWMLAVITVLAVVFLVVSRAAQGSGWAVGASAAVLMLGVVAAVHGGLFFLIWLVSLISLRRRTPQLAASAVLESAAALPPPSTPFGSGQPEPKTTTPQPPL